MNIFYLLKLLVTQTQTKRGQIVIKETAKEIGAIKEIQKGTNCEILNLKNRRIGRLKVHAI